MRTRGLHGAVPRAAGTGRFFFQYCGRSHGDEAVAREFEARVKTTRALVDEQGRGVCGLEGCTDLCHARPAPEKGFYPYCRHSHGKMAEKKERDAESAGGTAGRTAKRTLARTSPQAQQSTPVARGSTKQQSERPKKGP